MTTVGNTQVAPEPPGLVERARSKANKAGVRLMARWKRPALERARTTAEGILRDTVGTAAVRERLGVPRPVTVGVRESVRMFHRGRRVPSPYLRLAALYVVAVGFVLLVNAVRAAVPALPELAARLAKRFTSEITQAPALLVPVAFAIATAIMLIPLIAALLGWLIAAGLVSFAFMASVRQFRPVVAALDAIRDCGIVYGTVGPQRTEGLRSLALSMSIVRRNLRRAHRVRGTLPRRGDRVKAVRAHVRRVVKCLDAAEAQIDVDGDQALPKLVSLLDQVVDRYAEGRLGALLDEAKLTAYPAGRDWEALRLAILAVVIGVGAVGAGFLALSDPVTTVLIASVGVLGVALLYRKNLTRGIDLLGLWRP
ncbi:hypothetical protein [Streptomyces pristinaespiralis]|uniref:hypothetical protein n=1 Tax=Streptomyces pristinaespiralis TaxID=38300 RepID=UPI0038324487